MKHPGEGVKRGWGLGKLVGLGVKVWGFIKAINTGGMGKDPLFRQRAGVISQQ